MYSILIVTGLLQQTKRISTRRIIEYLKLAGTHKDHHVQLPAPHKAN